jgi:Fe-S oxidoreductase
VDYDLPNTLGIKVEHITQTLQGRGLKFKAPEDVTVAYHDPCRLGRMMGEYEAPRDLIQLVDGAEMVELENNKERALCCGVSSMMYCNDATKAVRRKRLDQGTDAGIDIMLGGCPKCYMHMQCMLNEERMNPEEGHHHDYEMMDLMQFLVACLEESN